MFGVLSWRVKWRPEESVEVKAAEGAGAIVQTTLQNLGCESGGGALGVAHDTICLAHYLQSPSESPLKPETSTDPGHLQNRMMQLDDGCPTAEQKLIGCREGKELTECFGGRGGGSDGRRTMHPQRH